MNSEKNLCRCCLQPHESNLKSLHSAIFNSTTLIEMLQLLTGLQIIEESAQICPSCEQDLINAFKFRHKVLQADNLYRQGRHVLTKIEPDDNVLIKVEETYVEPDLPPEQLICDLCSATLQSKRNLLRHFKLVHGLLEETETAENEQFLCQICARIYRRKYELSRHLKVAHASAGAKYVCPHCPKKFTYSQGLKVHLTSHSEDRPHICETCGRGFKTISILRNHREIHKDRDFKFLCHLCSAKFRTKYHLNNHVSNTHTLSTGFECPDCPAIFKQKKTLLLHQKIHSGDLIKCSLCPKSFKTQNCLNRHTLGVHSGGAERRFRCDLCSSSFTFNNKLKRHLATVHKVASSIDLRKERSVQIKTSGF